MKFKIFVKMLREERVILIFVKFSYQIIYGRNKNEVKI